jgi:hypothetical protein
MPEAGERDVGEGDLLAEDTSWHGQMVRVFGLASRADLNGKLGFAQGLGASGRIAVLVNPLGGVQAVAGSSAGGRGAPEVISIKRGNLTLLEGHRRQDMRSGDARAMAVADTEMPLESLREQIAMRPIQMIDGELAVMNQLRAGSAAASKANYPGALSCFEAALTSSSEVHDNKSLIRVHIMQLCWQVLTRMYVKESCAVEDMTPALDPELAPLHTSARTRSGPQELQEVIPQLYSKALAYASDAMDILEFRLGTRMRDGRSGENPVSSLFELTAEETSFLSVLIATGQAELWTFLGAPLALSLARNVFLPVLLNGGAPAGAAEAEGGEGAARAVAPAEEGATEAVTAGGGEARAAEAIEGATTVAAEAREPKEGGARGRAAATSATAAIPTPTETAMASEPRARTGAGSGADAASALEHQCWRRVAVALRVIEAAERLGTLATVWQERVNHFESCIPTHEP